MSSHSEVTPKKLSKNLVKKHKNYLKQYSREHELLGRVSILEEKKDQLNHWVETSDDESADTKKIIQQKKTVEAELKKLSSEYEKYNKPTDKINYSSKKNELSQLIKKHEEAINYWKNKNKEYSKKKT